MKKLLGVLFALALVVPAMAGNIFSNVETYGEVQTIGSLTENVVGDSSIRDTSNRVMFGLGLDLVEDVRANVSFLNTSYWGRSGTNGDNVNDFFDKIYVSEANVAIGNVFGALDVKVGRQFYGDEDSSVMYYGPTHYRSAIQSPDGDNPGYANVRDAQSLDGAVVSYNGDKWAMNAIYAKIVDTFADNDQDDSLAGWDVKANITNNLLVQAYMYDFRNGTQASKEQHWGFWGVKPSYTDDIFTVSAEFAKNYEDQVFGQNNRGWLLKADAKVNYTLPMLDFAPRIGYTHTEKTFESMGNYMPGLIFSNRTGQLYAGEDALRVLNAGVDFKFAALDKVSFALDYFAIKVGDANRSHADWLGNEFNLLAKYAVNEYVELHAGAGYMTNANPNFTYKNEDPYTGQLGMIVKF